MMSSQLVLLMAIATLSWINAVERCVDCNLTPTSKEDPDIPKSATCNNNCFLQEQTKPEYFTPWSKLGPVLQFDDAGIYYEPSEMLPFDEVAFVQQPFYILNPAYQVDHRTSRSATKSNENKEFAIYTGHASKTRHNKLQKHHKKEENGHKKEEKQIRKLPFYLDVDIEEPRTENRDNPDMESHLENLKLAEQYLSICLDLHVLEFYRSNDSTFKNLRDVWDDEKFHFYERLSDQDLENEIRNNCNHSINIVKKSLDEIKDTWPKNNDLSYGSFEEFPSNARTGDKMNPIFQVHHDDSISNASFENKIVTPNNLINTNHHIATEMTIDDPTVSRKMLITQNMLQDTVVHSVNGHKNISNQFQITLISPGDQRDFDVTTRRTIGSDVVTDGTDFNWSMHEPKDKAQETSTISNFYYDDRLHINTSYEPQHKHIEGKAGLSSYTDSKIYFIPMMQRTLNLPHNAQRLHDFTTPSYNDNLTESETVLRNRNDFEAFATTPYAESSKTYLEDDIQLRVSQIVTKEYPNDTAASSIEDIENVFPSEKSSFNKDMFTVSMTSDSTTETTVKIKESSNKIINAGNISSSAEVSPSEDFSGNLYFLYRNNSVPARFIQHSDGKINVGLDGYSLCHTLNESPVRSVLLNIVCNCVKFNNCTNTEN